MLFTIERGHLLNRTQRHGMARRSAAAAKTRRGGGSRPVQEGCRPAKWPLLVLSGAPC